MKCDAARSAASALIARIEEDRVRMQRTCVDEQAKFEGIDLSVPSARDDLSALLSKAACPALRTQIPKAVASIDALVVAAQGELQRLGCYKPKPSSRFDRRPRRLWPTISRPVMPSRTRRASPMTLSMSCVIRILSSAPRRPRR